LPPTVAEGFVGVIESEVSVAEVTVSEAALLVTLPVELLTTTLNWEPLSELVVGGVV
jgi:hypothetical protein